MRSTPLLLAAAVGAALAVTGMGAPAAATSAATCQATPLPALDAGDTLVTAGDPSGRYLAGRDTAQDPDSQTYTTTPVLWVNGRVSALNVAPLQPTVQVDLYGVNRSGTVAGTRMTDYNSFHTDAFVYRNGRYTMLPPPEAGDPTRPTGINDRGDVVGWSTDSQLPSAQYHALLWPAGQPGAVRELTLPGHPGASVTAQGIDEDGTVLGNLGTPPDSVPYIWPVRGTPYPLAAPAGTTDPQASAIRDGWVTGTANRGDQVVTVLWNLRTHRSQVVSTTYTQPITVNSHGTIAAGGAILHRYGRTVPLDSPSAQPVVLADNGTAAGNPSLYNGPAVVWKGC